VYKPEYEPLLKLADIIKVDFLNSEQAEIEALINRLKNRNLIFLAEKIETHEVFEYAKQLGFSLFQGFFFSKPEILTTKAISPLKTTYLQLMAELNQTELDFGEFSRTTSRDLALTYNLLRLVNSAAFGFRSKIRSVKHALVLLGEKEIRKWISLMLLHDLGENKPGELIRLSLIRARFAELIATKTKFRDQSENLFLAGLFSLLDVILDRPLASVLHEVQIPDEVIDCLLNVNKEISRIHQIIISYEQGQWEEVIVYAALLDVDYRDIADAYIAALQWYNEFVEP
jgi:EAL and modified HD-GYP domain-containing signal transduction protein